MRTVRDALAYLSSPELGAARFQDKPGAALNPRPSEAGARCASGGFAPETKFARWGRGSSRHAASGTGYGCQRSEWAVSSRYQLGIGEASRVRSPGCERDGDPDARRWKAGWGALTSGACRAAAQCSHRSRVRDAGSAGKLGAPEGLVATGPAAASPCAHMPPRPLTACRAPGRGGTR